MVSYVDNFSITVASSSYRSNVRRLQELFSTISARGREIGVSFSVPKTELIHWRTPSQRTPPSTAPIKLEGHLFHPSMVVRWLGYWFTPALSPTHHFSHRLSLAQAIFSVVKRLSSPGAGVRPFLCHRIATGLLCPILTYGADLLTPTYTALRGMNSFWHRVQRWTMNNLFSNPTSILAREACLPPIISYCRYRRRLAALRVACALPYANPASARLPQSFPSLSSFRAQDSSRHLTKGLSLVYLPPPRLANGNSLSTPEKAPPGRPRRSPHLALARRPHTPPSRLTRPSPAQDKYSPTGSHEKNLPGAASPS